MARTLSVKVQAGLAGTYKRFGGPISSSGSTFYTVPASGTGVVEAISIGNPSGSVVSVTCDILDASDSVISNIVTNAEIAVGTGLDLVQNKLTIGTGEKLRCTSSSNNNLHATISVFEIIS